MKSKIVDKTAELAHAAEVSQDVVYLMGFSFVLGSLFTVLVLLLLDFMRRNKNGSNAS